MTPLFHACTVIFRNGDGFAKHKIQGKPLCGCVHVCGRKLAGNADRIRTVSQFLQDTLVIVQALAWSFDTIEPRDSEYMSCIASSCCCRCHRRRCCCCGGGGGNNYCCCQVRGVAMNPVDHPMGGGTAGGRPSCSPWGLNSKGKKTRKKHKASNKWILVKRTKRA